MSRQTQDEAQDRTAEKPAPGRAPDQAEPAAEAPSGTDDDRLLEHEYDGIREYDNPMPGWWVAVFWATVLFSIGYYFHYQLSGKGTSILQAYEQDVSQARAAEAKRALSQDVTEEGLAKLMADGSSMKQGSGIFEQRCRACHGDKGQGSIGPNLTDDAWLHGSGELMTIYAVVRDGVAAKGMPAWSRQLSPAELRQVAAFVGTLRGRNVPGKPPEGRRAPAAGPGASPAGP